MTANLTLTELSRQIANGCPETALALSVLVELMDQAAKQNRDAVIENHGVIRLGSRRAADCSATPMALPAINLPRHTVEKLADLIMEGQHEDFHM